jgi:dynein heavy chain, axonemal
VQTPLVLETAQVVITPPNGSISAQAENYMTDIIDAMRNELRNILSKSVDAYAKEPRDKWLFDWPSQIILVVNQIFWCQEVEEAFSKLAHGNVGALKVRQ